LTVYSKVQPETTNRCHKKGKWHCHQQQSIIWKVQQVYLLQRQTVYFTASYRYILISRSKILNTFGISLSSKVRPGNSLNPPNFLKSWWQPHKLAA
jgi:hypothetical protein